MTLDSDIDLHSQIASFQTMSRSVGMGFAQ
jgi:hypothetical protein